MWAGAYNARMQDQIDYDALTEALARIGYQDGEAAEYHGTLCGALCVHKPADIDMLRLIDSGDRPPSGNDAQALSVLATLRSQTLDALEDDGMSFEPLLPDDDTALVPRVRALGQWCEGFRYGLSTRAASMTFANASR